MTLFIDGRPVTPLAGQTLLSMCREAGFGPSDLREEPLAAKIGGEVFTLSFVPLRKDPDSDRESLRRAMAASGGQVHLLRYADYAGAEVYRRTALFVMFLALRRLYPHARAKVGCLVGSALFVKVEGAEDFSHLRLAEEIRRLVAEDIPLRRRRIATDKAVDYFRAHGNPDKASLLAYRTVPTLDVYTHGDYMDYFYGEMCHSTACLSVWEVERTEDGFVFLLPDRTDPTRPATLTHAPRYLSVYRQGERWGRLMECETVADLNGLTESGRIRELVRVNEALHERRFSHIADRITEEGRRVVLLAGPSSSGKTTSANRLATQLRVHGKKPLLLSLDEYYLDRDKILSGPDGKVDLEHIDTLDRELLGEQMGALLSGATVEIPTFNFKRGKREWTGHRLRLAEDSVLIVEGIHGLNPDLLPHLKDSASLLRLFVSPIPALSLDDHNRIPGSYLRLLRRIVRDLESRGTPLRQTLAMWESVRRGEARWIMPYEELADEIFNSATLYELAVLKTHVYPLLLDVEPEEECYGDVRSIVKVLNYIKGAAIDDEIPPTSLVREFIGGNAFYRS